MTPIAQTAIQEAVDVFRSLASECRASAVWYDEHDTGSDRGAEWAAAAENMRRGAVRWDSLADRLSAARDSLSVKPRMFPLLDGPAIPWASIAPFEKQAQRNHSQTLERLAQRGGLSVCEALHVLLCVEWHRGDPKSAELSALSKRDAILKLTELALSSYPPEGEDTQREDQ